MRHRAGLALLGLSAILAASRAASPASAAATAPAPAAVPGARLQVFGGRSAEQQLSAVGRKLDATLAELTRLAGSAPREHALAALHALNPAVHLTQHGPDAEPLVSIDAITRGDPQRLRAALEHLGLERAAVFRNDVGGWLPVSRIEAATTLTELHAMRAALARTRSTGPVATQGDFSQGSATLRNEYSALTGTGITVGVLSDSFDCYAAYSKLGVPASGPNGYARNGLVVTAKQDEANGALPASVQVLVEGDCAGYEQGTPGYFLPLTDEGRAMLQIVHAVAPDADLAFHTSANSEADFAKGILQLAAAGANIEVDDYGYFDEPFFQDGIVAQAIDSVEAQGVAYFAAAGNEADLAYENTAPSFGTISSSGATAGELLLNVDTSGASTSTALPISIPSLVPGEFVALVLEWDQPYVTGAPSSGGATSQINLCVTGSAGTDLILNSDSNGCTGVNTPGSDPVQILAIGNPASASSNSAPISLNVIVGLVNGTTGPGRIKIALEGDGAPVAFNNFATHSATIQGHPTAGGAMAIGAAFFAATPRCGTSPAILERYSSKGGSPVLFDSAGKRLAAPVLRQKPDMVGPDGVNTSFFGYPLGAADPSGVAQCANNAALVNFFGTSAAAPHVAAAAALLLQANVIGPGQLYAALRTTAAAMDSPSPDDTTGFGYVRIDQALTRLPPVAPTLSVSPASVALGASATLTWVSINTTRCTASGGWSGSRAASGSATVTPSATGRATYSLSCSNAVGATPTRSVSLTVTAPPAHSGGGGGWDYRALLLLAALAAATTARAAARAQRCSTGTTIGSSTDRRGSTV